MRLRFEDIDIGDYFMYNGVEYKKLLAWLGKDEEGNFVNVAPCAKVKNKECMKIIKKPYWKVLLYNWFTVVSYYLRMKV